MVLKNNEKKCSLCITFKDFFGTLLTKEIQVRCPITLERIKQMRYLIWEKLKKASTVIIEKYLSKLAKRYYGHHVQPAAEGSSSQASPSQTVVGKLAPFHE
jgi:hypothetical protein